MVATIFVRANFGLYKSYKPAYTWGVDGGRRLTRAGQTEGKMDRIERKRQALEAARKSGNGGRIRVAEVAYAQAIEAHEKAQIKNINADEA